MNRYEGMFIFRPELSKDAVDKILGQLRDVITKHKGSVGEVKEWARQRLAYPIKKCKEGIYYLIDFHSDAGELSNIRKAFSLNDSILRVLMVK